MEMRDHRQDGLAITRSAAQEIMRYGLSDTEASEILWGAFHLGENNRIDRVTPPGIQTEDTDGIWLCHRNASEAEVVDFCHRHPAELFLLLDLAHAGRMDLRAMSIGPAEQSPNPLPITMIEA